MTRIGASQVFFNIVASWNADKLIRDQRSSMAVMKAVSLDTFEAILKPLDDFKMMIDQSTDLVRELSQEMGFATIEFEKFFGETHNIETMRDGLLEIGEAYAIAGSEALDAGSRASQVANLIGRGNISLLVTQANILSEISDLGAEDAMRGIIQLQQQTGFMYGDMTKEQYQQLDLARQRIVLLDGTASGLNKLNTVANRSVAMEGDIVHVMSQFAAQGHLVSDSFEAMAAMSAVLLEAGEEQGTAGRALRAIYARLGGNINGATDQMEAMNIQIRDGEGNMLSMEKVLENMSKRGWADMTSAQKQNIAQTVAGNRHYVRFIKLMENYDRFTGLTADGLLELDKASTQAAKAQEALAFQLESATVKSDNLKAVIGESLTPFMIGATKATNDYLTATSQILDGIGVGGEAIGRLHSTLKIGEGFIKFGLAVQSVGIGFEMYSSVMKSLNGIQAANENLHSKMANHLEFGVDATDEQKVILKGMQFVQQKINAAKEKERLITKQMLQYSEEILVNEEMNIAVKERQEYLSGRATEINSKRTKWTQYENGLIGAGNRLYDQRELRMKHIGQIDEDLRNKSLALYNSESATQNAYQKQVIADMEVFGVMSSDELDTMKKRNIELGTTHTILQNIKAENEKARALGNRQKIVKDPKTGFDKHLGESLGFFSATLGNEDRQNLKAHFQKMLDDHKIYILAKQKQLDDAKGTHRESARADEMRDLRASQRGYARLKEGMKNKKTEMVMNKEAFDAMDKSMKHIQGQRIQTMRGLETYNMAKKDAIYLDKTLNQLQDAAKSIQSQWNAAKEVSILMQVDDVNLKAKLAPMQDRINDSKKTEIERTVELSKMIQLLNMETKDILESAKYNEFNKNNQKYQDSLKGSQNATKRFAFTLSNTLGLALGTFGDGAGAARASILAFTTNIIGAGAEAGKSAVYMVKMQQKLLAVNIEAHGASVAMKRLYISMGLMGAALIAVGVGMEMFAKKQAKAAEQSKKLQEEMFEMENLMGRLNAEQKILNDADLAAALGMEDSTLYQLAQDTELAADAFDKLSNHTLVLTNEMNAQIESSLKLLNLFTDLRDGSSILGRQQFSANKRDVDRLMDDAGLFGTNVLNKTKIGTQDEVKYAKQLAKEIGMAESKLKDAGDTDTHVAAFMGVQGTEALIDHMIKNMEAEIQLTEEQLVLFEKIVDNDAIFTIIEQMNMMVVTADSAEIAWTGINTAMQDGANEALNSSNAIKNLTDEIYSFSGAREELFFGGKYGNVTGSLYRQVVKQGVGTLYHKNEIIMNTNFNGFFNEQEAANKIIGIVTAHMNGTGFGTA